MAQPRITLFAEKVDTIGRELSPGESFLGKHLQVRTPRGTSGR